MFEAERQASKRESVAQGKRCDALTLYAPTLHAPGAATYSWLDRSLRLMRSRAPGESL
jgi:hypothetical protein